MAVQTTSDPARSLDWYLRINRDNSKSFTVLDANGAAKVLTGYTVVINFKQRENDATPFLTLSEGSGITTTDNVWAALVTKAQAAKARDMTYFLEIVITQGGRERNWIAGNGIFHNGRFDGVSDTGETLTITDGDETVTIQVTDVDGGLSTVSVDGTTIEGDGSLGTPLKVKSGVFEQTASKDATGGYAGLTLFKINFKNVLNTLTSFFTNSNTAARTYTFQNRDGTIADDTDLGLKMQSLTITAVKTTGYSANANEMVPVDTTSGVVAVTFPTAPVDKTLIAVKHVVRGGTNTVTLTLGGSDKFNVAGGSASGSLTLANQAILCQYKSSGALWYVIADDLSLAQLDLRFQAALISGTNIKTVNGNALLGSGDIPLSTLLLRQVLGNLFSNVGAFVSGNYTQSGTTFTVNASTISGNSGGVAGTYTNRISYNYVTLLQNYVFEAAYTLGTVGAASTGLGFGIKSTALSTQLDYICVYDTSNGANAGKILVYQVSGGSGTLISTSTGLVAPATSDQVTVRIVAGRGKLTVTFTNVTQNKSVEHTSFHDYSTGYIDVVFGDGGLANIGRFCVWNFGFQGTITSLVATSNEVKNADYVVMGDSIVYGYTTQNPGEAWGDRLAKDFGVDVVFHAGNSLTAADLATSITEVVALAPKVAVIAIGVNDLDGGGGQNITTLETNVASMITTLQNAGITVYLTELLPHGIAGVNTHNTWLRTNYSSQTIRLFQAFTDGTANGSMPTTMSADNLHPNAYGHALYANIVENVLAGYTKRTSKEPYTFTVSSFGNNYGRDITIGTRDAFALLFISGSSKFRFGTVDATLAASVATIVTSATGAGTGRFSLKNGNATGFSSFAMFGHDNVSSGVLQINNSTKEVLLNADGGAAFLSFYSFNNLKVFLGNSYVQYGNWTTVGLFVGAGTTPTARLHISAQTTAASTAPIKLTTGTVMTTAEAGAVEYNNTPHFTNSDATRRHIALAPNTTKVTVGAPYTNDGYLVLNVGGTDFKVMTTA